MASTVNSLKASVLKMSISTNITTPAYKEVVCTIDSGFHMSRDVDSEETRCGRAKSGGAANYTFDGSFAINTTVGATEMSHETLQGLADTGAEFLFKIENPATPTQYKRIGQGFISSYNEVHAGKSLVKADFTIEVTGPITTV